MAGSVGSGYGSRRQRVFVLIDGDAAQGVFYTWEAAETFADENQYSLDQLMEYETPGDYPDHLHLMAAKWDDAWIFQGEWTRTTPLWKSPPRRIRLDHYHAKGNSFHLLRQREFDWEDGLLLRINPMAPDSALESRAPTPSAIPKQEPHWQPRVSPLKPLSPIQDTGDSGPAAAKDSKAPLPGEPAMQEEPAEAQSDTPAAREVPQQESASSLMVDHADTGGSIPQKSQKLPRIIVETEKLRQKPSGQEPPAREKEKTAALAEEDTALQEARDASSDLQEAVIQNPSMGEPESELVLELPKEEDRPKPVIQPKIQEGKLKLRSEPIAQPDEEKQAEAKPAKPETGSSPKFSFNKKTSLRLKTKNGPTPIPSFQPTVVPDIITGNKSSVELAHSDPNAMAGKKPVESEYIGKLKRIWSLKLILTMIVVVLCWSAGLYWVLRPEPTAESVVAEVITLNRARKIIIEPKMVFYQFDVDPVHQERYIQNLSLEPIKENEPISIPTYHALDTWAKPDIFIRPPYADIEVEEWWRLRTRVVKYGFKKRWEDGSILILDFESDTIVGWAQAKLLTEVLN